MDIPEGSTERTISRRRRSNFTHGIEDSIKAHSCLGNAGGGLIGSTDAVSREDHTDRMRRELRGLR
jgi:hypothetical protein